ncbi:oxidoreductase [Candidatus Aminicenantes bacterium AC-335-B20]|jgi:F420-non-reducing hydrogenase small subunit|nr:oxidoreductase [SCandidatus Aminicenantes bacterium Aminicenantia_JdfR_composite]MCP2596610.1 oxidoreductase [Candidatus Aminicenantes bacterium AC-335-G13]MCP2598064.1 oxidoreductase [Candidatus Aminicenantes bacterium AC-335-L06]MCP2598968.1 oxidoreductase [Candidatus Aminicenantes bacterium AC-335-B20]MCP2606304.1 oxidoreductase [Candidatus Aminicenantes bacterium AC-708-I09]MCP2618352.1 oxidoreductase [Candidatus Aminicenantes bacterium AC-335-A11]
MSKPKVAFYWCASCGGCEEAVVDLAENILKVVEAVDIVFWPVALDFKRKDIEAMPDKSIAVTFINGAIRLSEQEEMVKLLRKKSQLIVAFGSCAHLGGVPGLANFWDRESIFNRAYKTTPSTHNPEGIVPQEKVTVDGKELTLPKFYNTVFRLDQIIDVDYYLPGCAPPPDLVMNAINAILEGKLPPKGTVLSPNKSLCDDCKRNETKPEKLTIKEIKRPHEIMLDPEKCFLAQGVICMGPATRTGCGERCIEANMPCRGCFGPTDQVIDQGAKFLSVLASIIDVNDEKEIEKVMDTIVDPAGTFYRFSLPSSLMRRKRMPSVADNEK